jgi:hypothetical protein
MGGAQDEDALARLQRVKLGLVWFIRWNKEYVLHASGVDTFICPSSSRARVGISGMSTILLEQASRHRNWTYGAMIALQFTIGGEYDGDCTAPSHLDSSLSRSFAARYD